MKIRNYRDSDWESVLSWWVTAKEFPPFREMMLKDSTFIIEDNDKPVASLTVYLTNCKEVALIENLIKDPEFKQEGAIQSLFKHLEDFTKSLGYKRIIMFSNKEKLNDKYETFGYKRTSQNNFASFVKEL